MNNMPLKSLGLFLMLLVSNGVGATHPSDNDLFLDALEDTVCGFPEAANLVNMLPPEALECGPDGDLASQVPAFAEPCSTCEVSTLVNIGPTPTNTLATPPVIFPMEDIPEQGVPLGFVEGSYDAATNDYCLVYTPNAGVPIPVCFDAGPAAPLIPPIPSTPLGTTPSIQEGGVVDEAAHMSPSVVLVGRVDYYHDDAMLHRRAAVGDTGVYEPVDLLDSTQRQWYLDNAEGASITLELNVVVDGETQSTLRFTAPFLGQAVAAAKATVASVPNVLPEGDGFVGYFGLESPVPGVYNGPIWMDADNNGFMSLTFIAVYSTMPGDDYLPAAGRQVELEVVDSTSGDVLMDHLAQPMAYGCTIGGEGNCKFHVPAEAFSEIVPVMFRAYLMEDGQRVASTESSWDISSIFVAGVFAVYGSTEMRSEIWRLADRLESTKGPQEFNVFALAIPSS